MALKILLSSGRSGGENYENALKTLGAEFTTQYCPAVDTAYDGLILCGGDDVDPARFGQENRGSRDIDLDRDRAEFALIEAYLKAGKPILGICRGHQIMNIALGGTLIQDIPAP
ncbi:MAG: gamma-glutamyl-gamma-aminobutyrate hydrolase family protein, partial [Oscillospiraceae bacterium]|nr:gamma-glutamyl-gamma-aminobutyrate hydrolase family protein [Oscillospiraceae bacterium]